MTSAEEVGPVSSSFEPDEPADEAPDEPAEEPVEIVGPLPDGVRNRVVALAADALGRMPVDALPPALKRVASFAPARRARLAGTQIASVVASDESFREALSRQVRVQIAELAQAIESGSPPPAADPVEVAAAAYLLRPAGWAALVERAAQTAGSEAALRASRQATDQLERLRHQVDAANLELREARQRHRDQVASLKSENTELRHKLGEARARVRTAEDAVRRAEDAATQLSEAATAAASATDAEARRLRARIDELERDLANARRDGRAVRGAETMRARLLLDTMLDTAQGLRRELGLPAVEGSPADSVEAHVAEHGSRTPSSHGSMAVDDPALLDELLRLPRVHLIVDGYNVTKTAWPDTSLERQRDRLLSGIAPLAARSGAEVTVVFDAAETKERPLVAKPRGVRVLFSPVGVIADDVIRDLVAAEPQGRPLVVVSSDQAVVRDVVQAGARSVAATALSRLLGRS